MNLFSEEPSLSDDEVVAAGPSAFAWLPPASVCCCCCCCCWQERALSWRLARTDERRRVDVPPPLLLSSCEDEDDDGQEDEEDGDDDDDWVDAEVDARRLKRGCFVTGSSSSLSLLQRLADNCKKIIGGWIFFFFLISRLSARICTFVNVGVIELKLTFVRCGFTVYSLVETCLYNNI